MPLPPVPGDRGTTLEAESAFDRQMAMIRAVLPATVGIALAAALYLVTSTADAYLNVGDRITLSVLSFALAFLLIAATGLRIQRDTARSRFLEMMIELLSNDWFRNPGSDRLLTGEGRSLDSLVSWAGSMGSIRGLSRSDFERLTALLHQVSILTAGRSPATSASGLDKAIPEDLAQDGRDAFGLLERGEFDQALAKLGALRDLAIEQLGPLHQFTLRIRANIAYVHVEKGALAVAKEELQDLLRDQLAALPPDHADIVSTVQLLARID